MRLRSARSLSRIAFVMGGTVLGLVLLILLLRSVNLNQLSTDFADADYWFLALAVVPYLINLLLKVPRWSLLYGEDAPGWDTLFGAMTVGYAINSLLPLRLGELVRAYWVRDRAGVSIVRTLSTIALERVSDGITLVVMLFLVVPTVAFPRELLGPALTIGAVFIAALLAMSVVVYVSGRESHPLMAIVRGLEQGRLAPIGKAVGHALAGLQALRSRRAILLLVVYSIIIWGSNAVLAWLVLRAFHIDAPITAGVLLIAVLNLGMSVPSTPGYIGLFDYLMVLTLGLYSVARTPALASALALHVIAFVPVTIIGLIYIARVGMEVTLRMVRASAGREPSPPTPLPRGERGA